MIVTWAGVDAPHQTTLITAGAGNVGMDDQTFLRTISEGDRLADLTIGIERHYLFRFTTGVDRHQRTHSTIEMDHADGTMKDTGHCRARIEVGEEEIWGTIVIGRSIEAEAGKMALIRPVVGVGAVDKGGQIECTRTMEHLA